jgi:predicted nucleotidyltransferase
MAQHGVLGRILDDLERLAIPCMLVGSYASGFHGHFRATYDVDLVVDPSGEQLKDLLQAVGDDFYVSEEAAWEALSRRGQFNLIHLATSWKVDLIIRKDRPFSLEEFSRRREERLANRRIFTSSPEDTILAKLEWAKGSGSERQLEDARGVAEAMGERLDWDYLRRWAEELGVGELLEELAE